MSTKLANGYRIETGVIWRGDKTIGAIDMPELEGFLGACRVSDTLLDMFAMAALPCVVRIATKTPGDWPAGKLATMSYDLATAMIQERAKRVSPAAPEDGGSKS